MAAFHQIGFNSANLIREPHLAGYRGVILSPVNYVEAKVAAQVADMHKAPVLDSWFDAQLYVPTSERGQLRTWSYFPTDVDTADQSSDAWWIAIVENLVACCSRLGVAAVCSPAVLSRQYSDDYFATLIMTGEELARRITGTGMRPVQTVVVGMNDLAVENRLMSIASILTQSRIQEIYLVFIGTLEPRRELSDAEEIIGAMRLIRLLNRAGYRVTVGYTSSDMLLWKYAGALNCATGKFFNLRRFMRSRFEEPASGGGQQPYWFEEQLLAFLREGDLVRIANAGLLSDASTRNPFSADILAKVTGRSQGAWQGDSWRHYLWWFADAEARVSASSESVVTTMLASAESAWARLAGKIPMEERQNDGAWVSKWKRACLEA